jgi:hypothetical protein
LVLTQQLNEPIGDEQDVRMTLKRDGFAGLGKDGGKVVRMLWGEGGSTHTYTIIIILL